MHEHSELSWLLSSVTAWGNLNRMHQFKEVLPAARAGLAALPLSAAAGGRRARLRGGRGPGRRRPAPARRADARHRRTLQRPLRQRRDLLVVPGAPHPRGRRADHGPPGPDGPDVDDRVQRAGRVYILDEPDVVASKIGAAVTDSGTEVRRAPDKPGIANLIEILAVVRGVEPERIEEEFAGQGTERSRPRSPRRSSTTSPRPASATPSFERTRTCSSASSSRAPRRRARSRRRSPTCARRWASARDSEAGRGRSASTPAVTPSATVAEPAEIAGIAISPPNTPVSARPASLPPTRIVASSDRPLTASRSTGHGLELIASVASPWVGGNAERCRGAWPRDATPGPYGSSADRNRARLSAQRHGLPKLARDPIDCGEHPVPRVSALTAAAHAVSWSSARSTRSPWKRDLRLNLT